MTVRLYLTGTAGCGKTTLVGALHGWLQRNDISVATVNMDPGVERVGYPIDVDCREYVSLDSIMDEYDLGPNGAQIVAADLLALKHDQFHAEVQDLDTRYVLIDTPGQIELFAFRGASRVIVDGFGREGAAILQLFDPSVCGTANGFVTLCTLASTVSFRLSLPTIPVLSKTDLLPPESLERILGWSDDPDRLLATLLADEADMATSASIEWFKAIEMMGAFQRLTPVSSQTGDGVPELQERLEAILSPGVSDQMEGWRENLDDQAHD